MPKKLRKGQTIYNSRVAYLLEAFKRAKKNLTFDQNEDFFLKNYKTRRIKKTNKKIVLVQIIPDHYYLSHFALVLKNKKFSNYKFIGLWVNIVFYKKSKISLLKFFFDYIHNFLLKKKWSKMYKKIGIYKIHDLNSNFKSNLISYENSFIKKSLKNVDKNKINNIIFNNEKIGNYIYDTYLRYYNKITFSKKDKIILKKILTYVSFSYKNLNDLFQTYKKNIHYYLTSSHTYIQNGIPIIFFKKKGIKVIGGTKTTSYLINYNKNINGLDFENYSNIFKNLKNKKQKIKKAKKFIYTSSSNFLSRRLESKYNNDIKKMI